MRHFQSELIAEALVDAGYVRISSTTSPYPADKSCRGEARGAAASELPDTDDAGETDKKKTVYRFGSELRYRVGNASSTLSISRVEPT